MTLVTNMPIDQVIPASVSCDLSVYDLQRGIPPNVPLGSTVSVSWVGDTRQIFNDLHNRGVDIAPCLNKPVPGDVLAVFVEPIGKLMLIRLN